LLLIILQIATANVVNLVIVSPTQANPVYVLPGGIVTVVIDVYVNQNQNNVRVGEEISTATTLPINYNYPFQQTFDPATWSLVGGNYYAQLSINITAPVTLGTYNLLVGAKQPQNSQNWDIQVYELSAVRVVSVIPNFVWSITGNKVLDIVRKPGTFAGVGPTIFLRSNYNLSLTFAGFENLVKIGDPTQTIPKYYAIQPTTINNPTQIASGDWISATNLNTTTIPINATGGTYRVLWEKIVVSDQNTACEYEDPAGSTIIINVVAMERWIDPRILEYEIDYK